MKTQDRTNAKQAAQYFLEAWKGRRWGQMLTFCQYTWRESYGRQRLKEMFKPLQLDEYEVNSNLIKGDCMVEVYCWYVINGQPKRGKMRVICETAPYAPSLEGEWGVNPISVLKMAERK